MCIIYIHIIYVCHKEKRPCLKFQGSNASLKRPMNLLRKTCKNNENMLSQPVDKIFAWYTGNTRTIMLSERGMDALTHLDP